jgi:hypothetical protein
VRLLRSKLSAQVWKVRGDWIEVEVSKQQRVRIEEDNSELTRSAVDNSIARC